jgi:DNA polymerase/3'-5' exonuclease PolX
MIHAKAHTIAMALVHKFAPYCQHINIAGSVRRCKPEVGDIEIVAIPKSERVPLNLFGEMTTISPLQAFIRDGIKSGVWGKIKGGDKYVQLALPEGINLDLFLVTPPAEYGVIMLLRTGPADFNKWLVTSKRKGGRMPSNAVMVDGAIYVNGHRVPMPNELDAMNFFGIGWIDPQDRSPQWGNACNAQHNSNKFGGVTAF